VGFEADRGSSQTKLFLDFFYPRLVTPGGDPKIRLLWHWRTRRQQRHGTMAPFVFLATAARARLIASDSAHGNPLCTETLYQLLIRQ
jgi:hypothetical protein